MKDTTPSIPHTSATVSSRRDMAVPILATVQATAWQKAIIQNKKMSIKAHHSVRSWKVHTNTTAISSIAAHAIGTDFISGVFTVSRD